MLDAVPSGASASDAWRPAPAGAAGVLDELRRGLVTQTSIVRALILRETRTRFGKYQLGYLWAFIEPCLFILTFFLVFKFANRRLPLGMDIISFISTGLLPFQAFRNIANKTAGSTTGSKALLTYPNVKRLDMIIARFSLEAVTFTAIFVVLLSVSAFFAPGRRVDDLLLVGAGLALALVFGGGFGVFLGGLSGLFPSVERVQNILMRPLFWISGVFFTANQLPPRAREYLIWNPMLHVVEMIRDGFFDSYSAHHLSIAYPVMWAIICGAIGLHLQRYAQTQEDA